MATPIQFLDTLNPLNEAPRSSPEKKAIHDQSTTGIPNVSGSKSLKQENLEFFEVLKVITQLCGVDEGKDLKEEGAAPSSAFAHSKGDEKQSHTSAKSKTSATESEEQMILSRLHKILAESSSTSDEKKQEAILKEMTDLYFTSGKHINLSLAPANEFPLIISAITRGNIPVLAWLVDMGVQLPVEYELILALATPDVYKSFTQMIANRRAYTTNVLTFYQHRLRALFEEFLEEHHAVEQRKKQTLEDLFKDTEKQIDTIVNKFAALIKTTYQNVSLLLMCKINDPIGLKSSLLEITTLSILETKVLFLHLKSLSPQTEENLLLSYFALKARKEQKKIFLQKKLAQQHPGIQKSFRKLILLEEACFDNLFKMICKCYKSERGYFDKVISQIYCGITSEENTSTQDKLALISQEYDAHIMAQANKIKDEISHLIHESYSGFPKEYQDNHPALLHINEIVELVHKRKFKADTSPIKYFMMLRMLEQQLQHSGTLMKNTLLAAKEAIQRFNPSKEELQQVAELTLHNIQGVTQLETFLPKTHEEIVQQDKKRLKELEQEKRWKAQEEAAKTKALLEEQRKKEALSKEEMEKRSAEKSRLLKAYSEQLGIKEQEIFRHILSGRDTHKTIPETALTQLALKLELKLRKTKSGVLIQGEGSDAANFHLSHGGDRRGTLDGNTIADFRDILENLGITLKEILALDAEGSRSKPKEDEGSHVRSKQEL